MKKRPAIWPRLITASLVVFALFLLTSIVFMSRQRVDLVTPNYYTLELAHQDHIDQQQRAAELHERVAFHYDRTLEQFRIVFPKEFTPSSIEGDILLYRPSDAGLDRILTVTPSPQGIQTISTAALIPGSWRIEMSWRSGNRSYYSEASFVVR